MLKIKIVNVSIKADKNEEYKELDMEKEYVVLSTISKRQVIWRRLKLFGLVLICVVLATIKWATFMPTDVDVSLKIGLVFLFCITFAWISLIFWSGLFGFWDIL